MLLLGRDKKPSEVSMLDVNIDINVIQDDKKCRP